jgi:TonB-dependent Receptor Plug Domain
MAFLTSCGSCHRACWLRWTPVASGSSQTGPAALKSMSLERTIANRGDDAFQGAREGLPVASSDLCHHRRGHPAFRSDQHPGGTADGPGVEVARIDSSKWPVGIRGFGTRLSRAVLVLIEGRSVYAPLFAGTYCEVQDTLLKRYRGIEVIRAPGGAIWGPNAVNGVINIITKYEGHAGDLCLRGRRKRRAGLCEVPLRRRKWQRAHVSHLCEGLYASARIPFHSRRLRRLAGVQSGFRVDAREATATTSPCRAIFTTGRRRTR